MANKNSQNKIPKFKFNLYWLYGAILLGILALSLVGEDANIKEIPLTQLETYIKQGQIDRLEVHKGKDVVDAYLKPEFIEKDFGKKASKNSKFVTTIPSSIMFYDFQKDIQEKYNFTGEVKYLESNDMFMSLLMNILPFLLLIGIWIFFMKRVNGGNKGSGGGIGGVFNVGKSKAKLFDKNSKDRVTFKDVAGEEEAKEEIGEIVAFLKNPDKYTELGGKIPKGALLVGPPGTGKTLLAKAVAGEADVPFFSLSGSDFVEMFVGVGASRVRDLFKQAKEKSPCIVFIDEIDAVGRARGKNPNMGSNDERENTLNQLLTEMDGFGTNSGVIILAATNRVDVLDKALLRAGRFDRQIHVDLPDVKERRQIFEVHLKPLKLAAGVNPEVLAKQTPGFSGADIANVCNEAALIAARNNKKAVEEKDFFSAVDRIVGGLEKKNKIFTKEERKAVAIHEAGHASISWVLQYANPLVKVTIVPRGRALGAAWYIPEERQLTTKEQMLDEMCATLGGRAAEEVFLGNISSGALNDLEKVSKQANAMIAYYGMSDSLKNICYYDSTGQGEYSFQKPYSNKTAELIDIEVKKLIESQYQRAKDILTKYKDKHNQLADLLVEKEVIFAKDLQEIFGKRPWTSRNDILIEEQKQADNEAKKEIEENDEKKVAIESTDNSENPKIEASSQEDQEEKKDTNDNKN